MKFFSWRITKLAVLITLLFVISLVILDQFKTRELYPNIFYEPTWTLGIPEYLDVGIGLDDIGVKTPVNTQFDSIIAQNENRTHIRVKYPSDFTQHIGDFSIPIVSITIQRYFVDLMQSINRNQVKFRLFFKSKEIVIENQ